MKELKLGGQRGKILKMLATGGRFTAKTLAIFSGAAECSVSANLRNLRKEKYGAFMIHTSPNKQDNPFYYWLDPADIHRANTTSTVGKGRCQ